MNKQSEFTPDTEFFVLDLLCGYWKKNGFTHEKKCAKVYTDNTLTDQERELLMNDSAIKMVRRDEEFDL